MDPATLLDDCLERLRTGGSEADCLERYPEQAAELRPMLASASRLRRVLAGAYLPQEQRARAKTLLKQALAAQNAKEVKGVFSVRWWAGEGWWNRAGVAALAGVVAVVACSTWMVGTVAASSPGDQTYGLRVWVERVPAWFQVDPLQRASAELSYSERRLADLQERPDQIDLRGLDALLLSDQAAARAATGLPDPQRATISARVGEHARILQTLAQRAPQPPAAAALRRAAGRVEILGQNVDGASAVGTGDGEPASHQTPAVSGAIPAGTPTPLPAATEPAAPAGRATDDNANPNSAREYAPGHARRDSTAEPRSADQPKDDGAGPSGPPRVPPGLAKQGISVEPWLIRPARGHAPAADSAQDPSSPTLAPAPDQPKNQPQATVAPSKGQGHQSMPPASRRHSPGQAPDKQKTPGPKHSTP